MDINKLELLKNNTIKLQGLDDNIINNIILDIYNNISTNKEYLILENKKDINLWKEKLSDSMIDRLILNSSKIEGLLTSIDLVLKSETKYRKIEHLKKGPSNLDIRRIVVPFGVVLSIFESRPNVCLDIALMCIKTRNICILKGGKECQNTNNAIVNLINNSINKYIDFDIVALIQDNRHDVVDELLTQKRYIDLVIPRGSKNLINYVIENSKIPYIETGAGNCHLYVDDSASIKMAIDVIINAKYQRPSVCNSIETLLINENIAKTICIELDTKFKELGIEARLDDKTSLLMDGILATEEDYYTEYNDYIIAIKQVKNVDEAISHINHYSTKHSETIISNDVKNVEKFFSEVDSACLYHNSSTRFSDGYEFGFGVELGISTGKLHSRGPMGLDTLFTYKYLIEGSGEIRK